MQQVLDHSTSEPLGEKAVQGAGHTKLKFSYNLLHNSEETLNMHLQRQILNNKTFAYLAYKAGFFIHYISTMYQLQETYWNNH